MNKLCQCLETKVRKAIEDSVPREPFSMSSDDIGMAMSCIKNALQEPCTCQEKKEEPKPECDHVVGVRNIYHITNGIQPGFIEVHDSDLSKDLIEFYHLKRCPECGEKLNLS